jgi:hypothetical protein
MESPYNPDSARLNLSGECQEGHYAGKKEIKSSEI